MNILDTGVHQPRPQNPKTTPAHYFRLMKQLTLLGYFTSEIGCTQAQRYLEVPRACHGSVPCQKGDRAWFTPSNHTL